MTWKFRDTIQADFSGLGSLGERRQKLIEHFRTRTSSERPLCVRSVTVFADLEQLVFEAPDETRTISISIIGYVQTKQSRTFTMTNWIKSANWEPITGGLFSDCAYVPVMVSKNARRKSSRQRCKPRDISFQERQKSRRLRKNTSFHLKRFHEGSGLRI